MFSGRHALNLDAKGRLAVPTRHREKLKASCGGRVVLTQHPMDNCLVIYPEQEWERIAGQVAALSDATPQEQLSASRGAGWAQLTGPWRLD